MEVLKMELYETLIYTEGDRRALFTANAVQEEAMSLTLVEQGERIRRRIVRRHRIRVALRALMRFRIAQIQWN